MVVSPEGQEPLPLKVAPIQPRVTTTFHLQSRRDSDCQMWELSMTNLEGMFPEGRSETLSEHSLMVSV